MNIDTLHFDTLLGTYNNNSVYDCTFTLSNPLRNVQRIYLKSIEMPISFNNIRASNNTNLFVITIHGNGFTTRRPVLINEFNCTTITSLLTAINEQLSTVLPSVSFHSVDKYVYLKLTDLPNNTVVNFLPSKLLSVILGFTQLSYTVTNEIKADNSYLLAYDNYLSLYLQDIPVKITGYSNQLISYKTPLNAVNGIVYYLQELNSFSQCVEITDKNYILNRLRVVVYDKFGLPITNGLDYSFSLAVNYHEE
jgi:hypothetical protein